MSTSNNTDDCSKSQQAPFCNGFLCPRCKDFGLVHPRLPDGKVDWGSLIYCVCRSEKAGRLASVPPQEPEPEHYCDIPFEELYDFTMSWDWHRHYSIYNRGTDPGPCECESPEHSLEELHECQSALEEDAQPKEKPQEPSHRPAEKPEPKLTGGVQL